ncbi:MAG: PKD domain-containing protein [Candidatus Thermoplasmatota archaeon]
MEKNILLLIILLLFTPIAKARVDARFIIEDEKGNQIYMKTPEGEILFGNVLVGQQIYFNASSSNSAYPIDGYWWDLDGDGNYDKKVPIPILPYKYEKAGVYNVTLTAVASVIGDGDTVTKTVVVVEKLFPPEAFFTIERNDNIFIFNASKSYDKDGYIRSYMWDFDGDGIIDEKGSWNNYSKSSKWKYEKNGYYTVILKIVDYDWKWSEAKRIIKVSNMEGEINESEKEVYFINEKKDEKNIKIIVNNNEFYEFYISGKSKKSISIKINPYGENELYIKEGENEKIFFFKKDDRIDIYIGENISSEKVIPGFEILFFILAIFLLIKFRIQ